MTADDQLTEPPSPLPAGRVAPPLDLVPPPSRWRPQLAWPKSAATVLGAWLFVSSFLWPHARGAGANVSVVGALVVGFGVLAIYVPWVRWANAVLGAWLAASTLAIPHLLPVTRLHDLVLGLAVLGVSLVPTHSVATGAPSPTASA